MAVGVRKEARSITRARSWRPSGDACFQALVLAAAMTILVITMLFLLELARQAYPAFATYGWGFLFGTEWSRGRREFGALPFIYGTVVSSAIALAVGGLVGLGMAIFLTELAPRWLRAPLSYMAELLAAIPSVVYGFWGLQVVVPWMAHTVQPRLQEALGFIPLFEGAPYGVGMLTAGLVLGVMILPTVAAVSKDVISAVPQSQREGMLALGATRWETISRVVLPYARAGITGALILGLGRAFGETIATTMLIGNNPQIRVSLFAPASTMASIIASQFNESTGALRAALVAIALLLFALTLLVNMGAQLLIHRMNKAREV